MRITTVLGLLVTLALGACGGGSYQVVGTPRAAGADAEITLEDENGNVMVNLDVTNLLPPDRVGEGLTVYVVWFSARQQQPQKAGTLAYDADERRGQMMATTPARQFTLRVTAERDSNVVAPSEYVVLEQAVAIE